VGVVWKNIISCYWVQSAFWSEMFKTQQWCNSESKHGGKVGRLIFSTIMTRPVQCISSLWIANLLSKLFHVFSVLLNTTATSFGCYTSYSVYIQNLPNLQRMKQQSCNVICEPTFTIISTTI
jgi:hypothetical protein